MTDVAAARAFVARNARVLDRRRLDHLLGSGPAEGVLAALTGYRNPDGGFGWALEPDLRAPSSQPVGALHALELLEEVAPLGAELASGVCDWLASATLSDGGVPFATAGADGPGTSPVWAGIDPQRSSLHMTAAVCAAAHRLAAAVPAVGAHRWLATATTYCGDEIAAMQRPDGSWELRYVLQYLDAAGDEAAPAGELERVAAMVPPEWRRHVQGGLEDEYLDPLDFSPRPGTRLRSLVPPGVIDRDLDRLEAAQEQDGGWPISWAAASPAAALEWRGFVTVQAFAVLHANGRIGRG